MIHSAIIPPEGFVGTEVLIGRPEVTQEEAALNVKKAEQAKRENRSFNKPRRPRHGIKGVFPGGRSSLYEAIDRGEFPAPIKRGRASFWPVDEVRKALEAMARQGRSKAVPTEELAGQA
jgi:hypothetical protein